MTSKSLNFVMTPDSHSDDLGRVEKKGDTTAKPVSFFYLDSSAKNVSIVGDFNNWTPGVHKMERRIDGSWHAQISLENGHHRYLINADDQLIEDPKAHGIVRDEKGRRVCMVAVSGY